MSESKSSKKSIVSSVLIVSAMTVGFKLLGFVKQLVQAYYYGPSAELDNFIVAYGFVEGISYTIIKASMVSIISFYILIRATDGEERAKKFISALMQVLLPLSALATIMVITMAPLVARILAPKYSEVMSAQLSRYIALCAPLLVLVALEVVFQSVLEADKRFEIENLLSLFISVSIMAACYFFSKRLGVVALLLAYYIGYFIYVIVIFTACRKSICYGIINLKEFPEIKTVLIKTLPLCIGNGALQINAIVDKSVSLTVESGAASCIYYAQVLEQFITAALITTIQSVVFVHFADYVVEKNHEKVGDTLSKSLNVMIYFLLPISLIFSVASKEIVEIVYYRGNFSEIGVYLTSAVLLGYGLSFPFLAIRDMTIKASYAFGETKNPMIVSLISVAMNIVLSIILANYIGIFGIAVGTLVARIVGMFGNIFVFKKHLESYRFTTQWICFLKLVPAVIGSGLALYFMNRALDFNKYLDFILAAIVSMSLYLLLSFKTDESKMVLSFIKRKISRKGE